MPQIQIPDGIRPALALLRKYHFWMLAALLPLVLVPLLFAATGGLQAEIAKRQGEIKGKISAVQGVKSIEPHPNEAWSTAIDAEAAGVRRETLTEWETFWESQRFLRVWPKELGDDFLEQIAALKPDGDLRRPMLQRYQNKISDIVKKLPARMGADEQMGQGAGPGDGVVGIGPGGLQNQPARSGESRPETQALVQWDASDQQKLAKAFKWPRLPDNPQAATAMVVLAQEELWVYGLLCDVIAKANKGATGRYNAPVVQVDQMAVGYPAAELMAASAGENRISLPEAGPAVLGGEGDPQAGVVGRSGMPMGMPSAAGGLPEGGKPSHARFSGAGTAPPKTGIDGGPVAEASRPDSPYREWIYVDFTGKPLAAAELATNPAAGMVHLVPFVLQIVIDQRRFDSLLVELAESPVPIDVREVRINVGGKARAGFGQQPPAMAGPQAGGTNVDRPNDIHVELRGTVGLATEPNAAKIGIETPPAADAAALPLRSPAARRGRRALGFGTDGHDGEVAA